VKLRLLDDSVRLRLSRGEVIAVSEQGSVEARTRFPHGAALTFALEATDAAAGTAAFDNNRLAVRLPAAEIAGWAGDDTAVSLHGEVTLDDGSRLALLVEKDFQCVTPRAGEDQSDLFPNPDASC